VHLLCWCCKSNIFLSIYASFTDYNSTYKYVFPNVYNSICEIMIVILKGTSIFEGQKENKRVICSITLIQIHKFISFKN
jgi:hypothetical protein